MKTRRIPIAAAIAALMLATTPAVSAVLGEIASLSAIGEPFRAEIRVAGGSFDNAADCLRVVVPDDGSHDLPWLKNARIGSTGSGASARIVVSSNQPANEPALKLAIANICETQLRREYTLLLPYPATAPSLAAAPTREERRETPAAAPRATPGGSRTWATAPGESLATLAQALYPDDAAARRRFMRATAGANPRLFPDAASQHATLPSGTSVVIPDLRRSAPPRPAPERPAASPLRAEAPAPHRPPASSPPPVRPARPVPSAGDRVILTDDSRAGGSTPGIVNGAGVSAITRGVDASWSARERELAAAVDRSIIAEMELLSRIKELEQLQARLEEQTRALAAAAPPPPAPVAATPPAAPEVAPAPKRGEALHDWYLTGGLLLAILLLIATLRRRREQHAPPVAMPSPKPRPPATAVRTDTAAGTLAETPRSTTITPGHTHQQQFSDLIHWDGGNTTQEAAKVVVTESNEGPEEDHKSAVELAEIMMSFGRVQGAADTLAEFIHGNPKQAITPWIKLLDVYRAAGLRAEFEGLSRQLHKTFNVRTVSWDTYDNLRNAPLSLESLPHIMSRLQTLWRTRECQAFIQQLLRDNRDGSREGFPFAVIDELLVLENILEQELGPYKSYAMKAAELAR